MKLRWMNCHHLRKEVEIKPFQKLCGIQFEGERPNNVIMSVDEMLEIGANPHGEDWVKSALLPALSAEDPIIEVREVAE